MVGRIILGGGGDKEQAFEIDELFLKNAKNIVYIPVAWKNNNYDSCLEWFTNMVRLHNKDAKIKMLTDLSVRFNLQYYDSVYIGGGNAFKLLRSIRDNGFGKKLMDFYKNGGSIFGGSAGAMIFGRDIATTSLDSNEVALKDTSGLNICHNHDIKCHYQNTHEKQQVKLMKETKHSIIAIPEESALLIENGKFQAIGEEPITLIKRPKPVVYESGEYIDLS